MNKNILFGMFVFLGIGFLVLYPDIAFAIPGSASGLESKMANLQSKLIGSILPLMSAIGLIWAAILGVQGNPESKEKIKLIVFCSIVGFLAPMIINWVRSVVG